MEKILSDHHLKSPGFMPLEMESTFLGDSHFTLDFYESKLETLGKVKIVGYKGCNPTRVYLDTREVDCIPFAYIETFADKMHGEVLKRIYQDEIARCTEANRIRDEKEELLSRPGNRVHVSQRYGRNGFAAANGTVLTRQGGEATVRLDYGMVIDVPLSELSKPKENPKIYVLQGELNCLYGRLESTYGKPFGVDNRAEQRKSFQSLIDTKIKELEALKAIPV